MEVKCGFCRGYTESCDSTPIIENQMEKENKNRNGNWHGQLGYICNPLRPIITRCVVVP